MQAKSSFTDILHSEFKKRSQKNSNYSLSAFARDIGLSASRLSQILNKKLGLSTKSAEQIVKKLKLSDADATKFMNSVDLLHSRKALQRERAKFNILKTQADKKYQKINLDYFEIIADWTHYALLEFLEFVPLKSNYSNITDYVARTNLKADKLIESIDRLLRVGLVHVDGDYIKPKHSFTATPTDIPSEALKKHHEQILNQAKIALKEKDVATRDITSTVVSIDKSSIELAKTRIKKFRRSLVKELNESPTKDAVYCLSIQFFDLF